jgi:hypothetical protein
LAQDQLDKPITEICRAYNAPGPSLPTIILSHRNTPQVPARQQMKRLQSEARLKGQKKRRSGDEH